MTDVDEIIQLRRGEWEDNQRQLAELRDAVARLQRPDPPRSDDGSDRGPVEAPSEGVVGRRRALGALAGAAAAGVAGAVVGARPAAAADGEALKLGDGNQSCTAGTAFAVTGSVPVYGLGVSDNTWTGSPANSTAFFHAKNTNFFRALELIGESTSGGAYIHCVEGLPLDAVTGGATAAQFQSNHVESTGVQASGAVAVVGRRLGMWVAAQETQLRLAQSFGTAIPAPPSRTSLAWEGDLSADHPDASGGDSALWFCTSRGTPGTWRKLAGPGTAGSLHVLPAPKRVYDSRPGTQPAVGSKTPLAPNTTRVLDLKVNGSGVPAGATAALLTVLLVNAAQGNGNLTVWANGVAKPSANTMVWGPGGGRFTATAVSALSGGAGIQVQSSLTTDLVIDVVGYYR